MKSKKIKKKQVLKKISQLPGKPERFIMDREAFFQLYGTNYETD